MAKVKKTSNPKRPKEYEKKLAVKGSFLEVMKAAAKNANNNKKEGEK